MPIRRNIAKPLMRTSPVALALALMLGAAPEAAQAQRFDSRADRADRAEARHNTHRINKFIKGLTPQRRHKRGYRSKVRKITTWRKGAPGPAYYINYNHSVDLSVYFGFNSSRIAPAARPILDDLGRALSSPGLRHARYLIAGHTDAQGARGYNQWLSEQRALAVVDYLERYYGIHPHRLVALGFGEEQLVYPQYPRSPRNRRVEVSLIENDQAFIPRKTDEFRLRRYRFTPLTKGGVR